MDIKEYELRMTNIAKEFKKALIRETYSKSTYQEAMDHVLDVRNNLLESNSHELKKQCDLVALEIKKDAFSQRLID
ncbi:hypothetical protein AALA17_04150 [Lactobacillaceae bacterium 24-114]